MYFAAKRLLLYTGLLPALRLVYDLFGSRICVAQDKKQSAAYSKIRVTVSMKLSQGDAQQNMEGAYLDTEMLLWSDLLRRGWMF
jgi:hypothetical protein